MLFELSRHLDMLMAAHSLSVKNMLSFEHV